MSNQFKSVLEVRTEVSVKVWFFVQFCACLKCRSETQFAVDYTYCLATPLIRVHVPA